MLGDRLNDAINQLNKAEQQLMNDALLLTGQLRRASEAVVTKTGEELRLTLADADITAYNASYSLPCRDQIPRILYVSPPTVRLGIDEPELKIRGNFLDLGEKTSVIVGGVQENMIARSRNEIVIKVPDEVITSINASRSITVEVKTQKLVRKNWLVACPEELQQVQPSLTTSVKIRPRISYSVRAAISGTYEGYEQAQFTHEQYMQDEDCDASYDVNDPYCLPVEYSLDNPPFSFQPHSANCNSAINTPRISGPRCIEVPAHIGGCGPEIGLFGVRACFKNHAVLFAKRLTISRIIASCNSVSLVCTLRS